MIKSIISQRWLSLLFVVMAVSASVIFCSDDDNDGGSIPALLCGTWKPYSMECWKNGEMVGKNLSNVTGQLENVWIFSSDGALVWIPNRGSYSGSIAIKNNHIVGAMYDDSDGSWWDNLNEEIINLTEAELTLSSPYTDDEYDYQIIYLSRISDK